MNPITRIMYGLGRLLPLPLRKSWRRIVTWWQSEPWNRHGPFPRLRGLLFVDDVVRIDAQKGVLTVHGLTTRALGDICIATILDRLIKDRHGGDPDLIVDVGAHAGWFTMLAAARGERVYSFEPNPSTCGLLRSNLSRSGLTERVKVHELAVSETSDEVPYYRGDLWGGLRPESEQEQPTHIVQTTRLDACVTEDIYVLKVDVEGREPQALWSAGDLLRNGRITYIIVEFTAWWIGASSRAERQPDGEDALPERATEFIQACAQLGYEIYAVSRSGRPYLYGPILPDQVESFVRDHVERKLQTDLFMRQRAVWTRPLPVRLRKWRPNRFLA